MDTETTSLTPYAVNEADYNTIQVAKMSGLTHCVVSLAPYNFSGRNMVMIVGTLFGVIYYYTAHSRPIEGWIIAHYSQITIEHTKA